MPDSATDPDSKATYAGLWYVKRGNDVRGPFRWDVVQRDLALGRIRPDDRISRDGTQWQALPLPAAAGCAGEAAARSGIAVVDERRGGRAALKTAPGMIGGSPEAGERRAPEPAEVLERRARSERIWASLGTPAASSRAPLFAVALLLTVVVALAVRLPQDGGASPPDCSSAPGPRINWDFCARVGARLAGSELPFLSARNADFTGAVLADANLQHADLSYADLSAADLTRADLRNARLVGVNLRAARLNHALLAGADLGFADLSGASVAGADLTGARLSNVLWVDGASCDRDAIGSCERPGRSGAIARPQSDQERP